VNAQPSSTKSMAQLKSPGMKYKHYAPEVPLWLVEGTAEAIQQTIDQQRKQSLHIGVLASSQIAIQLCAYRIFSLVETIHDFDMNLYDALRLYTKAEVDVIISETYPERGLGQAVMNRLLKAASKYIKGAEK